MSRIEKLSIALAVVSFVFPLFLTPTWAGNENLGLNCSKCHSDYRPYTFRDGKKVYFFVDPGEYAKSAHGSLRCTQCHSDFPTDPHARLSPTRPPHEGVKQTAAAMESCGRCHTEAEKAFEGSVHAKTEGPDGKSRVNCTSCHGYHYIMRKGASGSTVTAAGSTMMCLACHNEPGMSSVTGAPAVGQSYLGSVHGKKVILGAQDVASCSTCHGTHSVLPVTDPLSRVSYERAAATCAQCHKGADVKFTLAFSHRITNPAKALTMSLIVRIYVYLIVFSTLGFMGHMALDLRKRLQEFWRKMP